MNKQGVIDGALDSFIILLDFIKNPIKFHKIEAYKFKAVVEGRRESFDVALEHLTIIKQLEEQEQSFSVKMHEERLYKLVEYASYIYDEIMEVLRLNIDTNEVDDDKQKAVIQSKSVALSFLQQIMNTRDSIKFTIDNNKISKAGSGNFTTDRVKNK